MSELRKRQTRSRTPVQTKVTSPEPKSNGSAQNVKAATSFSTLLLLVSCALSAAWWLTVNPRDLPESYAVCSRSGSHIYTVDRNNSVAQCLVVQDSVIADTGYLTRWKQRHAEPLHVRYLEEGSVIVPGLMDSHAHILEYGANAQLPLEGAKTVEDTVAIVRNYILAHPDIIGDKTKIIEGWGWDHTQWPVQEWPTADALDADPIIHGRPVLLHSKDGHAMWISNAAMAAGLPYPDEVEGGIIVRDGDGRPTGTLLDNAHELAPKPTLSEQDLSRRLEATIKDAVARGLTCVHDAGFNPISLDFMHRQSFSSPLQIRIYGMTRFEEHRGYWGNTTKPILNAASGHFTARSVKIFADGERLTLLSQLHDTYHDNVHTKGFMRIDPELLNDIIPRYLADGWQVNVHAIGDYANGIVLDAFEKALVGVDVSAMRPRLEHAQILTQEDMQRIGRLGVIASVQPTHAISDMWFGEERLGPERVKGLYAFRSILDNGARLALGSDFPVEDMNPLSGFYAAVTRLSPDGKSPHGTSGWFPEQRLTREEALRGMTIDSAYASFTEDRLGSIVPGKLADYVVLSRNIMEIPYDEILATKVQATVVDGRPVYGTL
ncbi:hypothetical protein CONPUDRAFT_52672 [Coniophora puteana RWD-64-598 SS2]|uniref:Amidohydrolase 3 domain-containing protein n=1 Tax=Coniophora puteana (strain RWD-64-598) TaxID=741705 RepID=A0A5M3MUS5_CONPW|nr:uncharacterized protein CONPUDRAFT_52672 [Coniophora puteana RWD-64-598 SS2]EIW82889.1 hypothetical protein CONPUDRAFT_52672 [Coniophora puteana RWD-64-598 SS2]